MRQLRRSNATHVVTGHADGCVRWHVLEHSATTRAFAPLRMSPLPPNSFCPNSTAHDPEASIKLVTLGKVYPKQRRLAAVAVTEADTVLMLRDKGLPPVTASSPAAVHHVQLDHRQVRVRPPGLPTAPRASGVLRSQRSRWLYKGNMVRCTKSRFLAPADVSTGSA